MPTASYTVTANSSVAAYSVVHVPCIHETPFNVSFAVNVTTTAQYSVEHTFDNPFSVNLNASASAATWFQHEFVTTVSTNQDGNYAFPVQGIRLKVFPNSDNGIATLTIVQAGATR